MPSNELAYPLGHGLGTPRRTPNRQRLLVRRDHLPPDVTAPDHLNVKTRGFGLLQTLLDLLVRVPLPRHVDNVHGCVDIVYRTTRTARATLRARPPGCRPNHRALWPGVSWSSTDSATDRWSENLTNVRLVPPSTAQSQNHQAGIRPVPLSPSSTAESRPIGDKFGDSLPIEATDR